MSNTLDFVLPQARRFVQLALAADAIIDSPDVDWKTKYDLIFSEDISAPIKATGIPFDREYSDHGYEDDARAYVRSLMAKATQVRRSLERVDARLGENADRFTWSASDITITPPPDEAV